MANNRLYIINEDGVEFMLAKSDGKGWYVSSRLTPDEFVEALDKFLEFTDIESSYNNSVAGVSRLRLIAENDPAYAAVILQRKEKENASAAE